MFSQKGDVLPSDAVLSKSLWRIWNFEPGQTQVSLLHRRSGRKANRLSHSRYFGDSLIVCRRFDLAGAARAARQVDGNERE